MLYRTCTVAQACEIEQERVTNGKCDETQEHTEVKN